MMKRSGGRRLRFYLVFFVLVGLVFVLMYEQVRVPRDTSIESTRIALLASGRVAAGPPSPMPVSTINPAVSDALWAPIRRDLAEVEGIGEIKAVEVVPHDLGLRVAIDLAGGRDSEEFVVELLTLVQAAIPILTQLRVSISQGVHGSYWVWEKASGELSFTTW